MILLNKQKHTQNILNIAQIHIAKFLPVEECK